MEVTEVRVFPKEGQDKKLKAYATITFEDAFVVRNIKVIEGSNGLFIAMPSRKNKISCLSCGFKNEIGSKFCNQCGVRINEERDLSAIDVKNEHRDIAHPITQQFRDYLQQKILSEYSREVASV